MVAFPPRLARASLGLLALASVAACSSGPQRGSDVASRLRIASVAEASGQSEVATSVLASLAGTAPDNVDVQARYARALARANPRASLVLLPNVNHVLKAEASDDRHENFQRIVNDVALPAQFVQNTAPAVGARGAVPQSSHQRTVRGLWLCISRCRSARAHTALATTTSTASTASNRPT